MSSVAAGVQELRVKDRDGIYRVFYLTKMEDGIYVFHAFQKKTIKTPDDEILLEKKVSKSFWRDKMAKQVLKSTKKIKPVISRNAEDIAVALGLPKSTAIEWQVRQQVTEKIIKIFDHSQMTITDLAKKAETSRARITRILKKDTSDISLDVLLRVLGATGQKVELKFLRTS